MGQSQHLLTHRGAERIHLARLQVHLHRRPPAGADDLGVSPAVVEASVVEGVHKGQDQLAGRGIFGNIAHRVGPGEM
jgi:hypothetical protein